MAGHSKAGYGGIIRYHSGSWVTIFFTKLGSCTIIEAEQWAIYKRLNLTWELGLKNIILDTDAKNVVQMISNQGIHASSLLLFKIYNLLLLSWKLEIHHISKQ